ncbi:hypothetical protein CLHOM_25760 [Clostridium homopropionicum DSM 5847]|uniref:Bacteriocin class II with double-glycine leader peptide n=1 Tax=Clostridium homopropionicum DSM 5847 TaxID=1121318 RepID=A0A0L6Z8C2_9CLOT|nr:hypothetical protein [Clostridium homopropionicum]KOA19073.1 hypothetical protein CLHOM_25760 [Clostridium homopropionicum DSM 5847]SFG97285.1 hypothetical protein SAMN04488501_12911 [Clostridium homopropionicum]
MSATLLTYSNDFECLNDYELQFTNGGTVFGAIAGICTSAAGACAIVGGAYALQGAAAGATLGPIGAIAGGVIGVIAGAMITYNNI